MESKAYAWKWVTVDTVLSKRPCELLYAHLIPSTAATCTATIYDGTNTSGKVITAMRTASSIPCNFTPPVPVYCENGLFFDAITVVKGCFIMWRELGKGE